MHNTTDVIGPVDCLFLTLPALFHFMLLWNKQGSQESVNMPIFLRSHKGQVQRGLGGRQRWEPLRSNPRLLKLAVGPFNVTALVVKEPELVEEAEIDFWNQSPKERLFSMLLLVKVRGWGRTSGYLLLHSSLPLCWSLFRWARELFPCNFGLENRFWLLFVLVH